MKKFLKHLAPHDLWLLLSAGTTGSALIFALVAPVGWVSKIVILAAGLTLAVAYHVMWWRAKGRKSTGAKGLVVLRETVLIDVGSSSEITFAPPAAILNPRLAMTAHGRPVVVEDVWHAGVSVVSVSRSILYWHEGVTYAGHIDVEKPLKILLRNEGFAPATVRASIVVPKE